jgi:thioredoxin reductase (NADPH)
MTSDPLDCLIIGGGPAGLTAGIYLGRFRRRVLVADTGQSRMEWIPRSHNLPGFLDGVEGSVLLETMREQARRYDADVYPGRVENVVIEDDLFRAEIEGRSLTARTVLLATGVVEIPPPLPHVADAIKQGLIRTCPICDGYESMGKRVAVLGEGDHAAAEALFLRTYVDDLSLLLPDEGATLSDDRRQALAEAGIAVRHVRIGAIRLQDDGVTALTAEDGADHRFDVIYSAFGTTAQTGLAQSLGARMDDEARLIVSHHQETSIPGLYAAGDLVRGLNQISVATGEAAIAATAIHNRLRAA